MSRQQSGGERGFPWLGQVLSLLTLIAASALAGALAASRHAAWPWVVTLAACAAGVAWLRVWSARFDPLKKPMTDSQRAEESGRASSDYERLSRTIAAADIGTWDWDLMANELAWSDNLEQVLGVEGRLERSLEGFLTIVAAEDHALIREAIEKSLQDPSRGVLVPHEFRVGPEPPYRWIEGNGRLFRDDEGRPVRMMGTIMDVTRRRLADDEVRRASAAKSTFVTSMSHEMRTPLNGVIGMIELLGQTRVSEQQRGFLDTLSKSAESLLALVNDVLDLSKVEAGALELEEISFDARRLARDAVGVVAQQAERKGLALSCRLDPGLPAAVLGDPGRLRQVLLNLLSNAVKFTPAGQVVVHAFVDKETRRQGDRKEALSPCLSR